ncbi:DUF6261 family protein [Streptococcus loxodontisalivarius]|uniref:Uncharacterized protein n=1 Tax=Streptococcus loxodontisalivarius TaxID=1349415 RepID=A0ABS2PUJ0_9STRE|nr:DUF6261 family protein [Streptococcus loxodontisalivarius]MBM7643360.1 hypothetical protein [Streptococcus loxodontisalivarius]
MTISFTKLSLGKLSNTEMYQLASTSLNLIDKSQLNLENDRVISTLIIRLRQLVPSLGTLLKEEVKSDIASSLKAADKLRNDDLSSLFASIKLYKNSRQSNKQEAVKSLSSLFEQYKGVSSLDYEKKTAELTSLLDRLSKAPYKESSKLLVLGEQIENLRQSQADFYNLYLKRAEVKANRVTNNKREVRLELEIAYRRLCDYLEIVQTVSPLAELNPLTKILESIRSEYKESLNRREGHKKEKKISTTTEKVEKVS